MPEEYFLTLVGPRVAPADRLSESGLPLEDGHTLPFVVDRGWVGPAGTYIEQWSIRTGETVLYRNPAKYIEVRGFQSVRRFSDTVRVPVKLEPGVYDIVFLVEDYRMGSFAVEAHKLSEKVEAPAAAEPAPAPAPPPAAVPAPKPAAAPLPAPMPAAARAAPAAPAAASSGEDPAAVRKRVYEEELAKGSDPRVAEGRAKSAEIKARKAASAPAAPAAEPAPAPAPEPPPEPEPAPPAAVGLRPGEPAPQPPAAAPKSSPASPAASAPPAPAPAGEDPAAVRKRVYEEELAKGSDPRVAEGRAKSAEIKARKAASAPAAPAGTAPPASASAAPTTSAPAAPPKASPDTPVAAAPSPLLPDAPPGGGGMTASEGASVRDMVLKQEIDRGTAAPVAEALAKAAEIRAEQGVWWRPDW